MVNSIQCVWERLEAALFPPVCVLCAATGQAPFMDLCGGCAGDLPVNINACARCAEPLAGAVVHSAFCGACLRRPPRFDAAYCAYRYGFPIDHLVRGLKYGEQLAYGRVLGTLLASYLRRAHPEPWPECVVPVPLADGRFRERGFNQAIEIGRELQARLGLPLATDVLVRTRATREQAGLDRRERRKNLRNAFAVSRAFQQRSAAILDDVITTGSTVNEIARVLRRAGVERIEVWAVARATR